jgi:hypothetical protein
MFRQLQAMVLAAAGIFVCYESAVAKVVRLEVTRTEFYGSFRPGDFIRIDGRIVGELAPDEPIPGLDKAPKNARGRVEYAMPIVIIAPKEPANGNGALLFDIPNRHRAISHLLYNGARDKYLPIGSLDAGTGFLQDRGFTVVTALWELGDKITLPRFTDGEGKTRYVEGVGIAAIRDIVDFLHHAAADETGTPNPFAGTVNRALAVGYSQTARVLKAMMIEGFNRVDGRRVFDGIHVQAGHSALASILATGTGPVSSTDGSIYVEPFTYEDIVGRMVKRGEVPPKMAVTHMTTDYLAPVGASLSRTGSRGTDSAPIPANVRMYDVAGASHVRDPDGTGCELPPGQLDWFPVMRAVLVSLDLWVAQNRPPPPSTLISVKPRSPGEKALPTRAPASLPNAVLQMPQEDADGNFIGGVRLPDVEAPLGVHGALNSVSVPCRNAAAYLAFAKKPGDRKAGDTRPSIAERYKGREDYLNRIRVATRRLIEQGFLLQEDGAIIIHAAAQSPAFE